IEKAGPKVLAWTGGGVTVLGVALLLVIAARQGLIGPDWRVLIGAIVGAGLLACGGAAHRTAKLRVVATIAFCAGLAAEYLVVIGAVRWVDWIPAIAGYALSALIATASGVVAKRWQRPWIAALAFATSGLLAPA